MKRSLAIEALFEGLEVFHLDLSDSFFWAGGKFIYSSGEEAPGFSLLQKYPNGWEIKDGKPELILCPADVGRRVRIMDGGIGLILQCDKAGERFFIGALPYAYSKFGICDKFQHVKELLA